MDPVVPTNGHLHRPFGTLLDDLLDVRPGLDRLISNGDDHIALCQSRFLGRGARRDLADFGNHDLFAADHEEAAKDQESQQQIENGPCCHDGHALEHVLMTEGYLLLLRCEGFFFRILAEHFHVPAQRESRDDIVRIPDFFPHQFGTKAQ